ncbi:MAG: hypothetical protein HYY76_03130 [Acidobacteria bacterium]|nr:hypothetical protein [Acidobacteriota bacterium]
MRFTVATLADVFQELNALKARGVTREYALGGATAALFYSEPVRTYDVDVFVLMPVASDSSLVPLRPIYEWARNRGFTETAEHVVIHGVPVQFPPAHNALAEEAVISARVMDYAGTTVRVISPEHLVALALQVGGRRQRERAWHLLESGHVDRDAFRVLLSTHGINVTINDGREE